MTTAVPQSPASPSSSPRLPSPPPFPEVQIGPKSPSPGQGDERTGQDADTAAFDNAATRRIRPGTKAADMSSGPPLVPLAELDSPFQLQEHLKALYLDATWSEQNDTIVPITRETATLLATPPESVDRSLWLYELCRFLVQKTNSLIVGFFSDSPPCSAKDCPEMRASEWQYLCAVHDPPKSCCAIDYCCHTLDWAANTLTSQKHFPSRLTLGGDAPGGGQASVRQLTNIFRRVYRMFAHAWFQHRAVFWALENQEGTYCFYKTVCDVYQLIPEENYTVPPEAEGLLSRDGLPGLQDQDSRLEPNTGVERISATEKGLLTAQAGDQVAQTTLSTGATTRRHKSTPSTGSFVNTIAEGDEEVEEKDTQQTADASGLVNTTKGDPSGSPPKKDLPEMDFKQSTSTEAEETQPKETVQEPSEPPESPKKPEKQEKKEQLDEPEKLEKTKTLAAKDGNDEEEVSTEPKVEETETTGENGDVLSEEVSAAKVEDT